MNCISDSKWMRFPPHPKPTSPPTLQTPSGCPTIQVNSDTTRRLPHGRWQSQVSHGHLYSKQPAINSGGPYNSLRCDNLLEWLPECRKTLNLLSLVVIKDMKWTGDEAVNRWVLGRSGTQMLLSLWNGNARILARGCVGPSGAQHPHHLGYCMEAPLQRHD